MEPSFVLVGSFIKSFLNPATRKFLATNSTCSDQPRGLVVRVPDY
jgi:hypothetical protein